MSSVAEPAQSISEPSSLFFVLSGEHASLPAAEVKAILEAERQEYRNVGQSYRLLTLSAPREALAAVSQRSLMYDWCGVELGRCDANGSEIFSLVRSLALKYAIGGASSFAVRCLRLGGTTRAIIRTDLEREIGAVVKDLLPDLTVRLGHPDVTFACVLFDDLFLFGVSDYVKPSGLIAPRRPRKRPVFHPSTMPPKIARCMVNLARATPGLIFADPFSGVGGILIEAAVVGCKVVGMDASPRMLRGARRNAKFFGLQARGFVNGDARHLPLRDIGAIATDPPYGRDSSTMGVRVDDLYRDFLSETKYCLSRGSHLCISSPVEVEIESYAQEAGFELVEKHLVRVHRSLTRQFIVLRNT
jgi:tRNA (guanine10-N2)-dimethyltransferase